MNVLFMDCDGTILELVDNLSRGPRNLEEAKFVAGAADFLSTLPPEFEVYVVTNQPDVSRQKNTISALLTIHSFLQSQFPIIKEVLMCTHDNSDNCYCRKPRPYLVNKVIARESLDTKDCAFVGDSWIDISTARNAQILSILYRHEHSWRPTSQGSPPADLIPDFEVQNYAALNELIANLSSKSF